VYEIGEVFLPGIGRKFQIETIAGDRLVIVIHDDGTRELYHFPREAPDRAASVLRLTDGEARQIAGIVGGLTYVPRRLPNAEIVLGELVLEWLTVAPKSPCAGKTIGELRLRKATGASIVSILERDEPPQTNPGPDTVINADATLVVAGDRAAIAALKRLLTDGEAN
jgi:TrkA domain protein